MAAVLPPNMAMGNNSAAGAGAFSPLTLYECTLTNAAMLLESMTLKELAVAMRMTNQLCTQVVDVLQPTCNSANDIIEIHKTQCSMPVKTQSSTSRYFDQATDGGEPECKKPYLDSDNYSDTFNNSGIQVKEEIDDDDGDCILFDDSSISSAGNMRGRHPHDQGFDVNNSKTGTFPANLVKNRLKDVYHKMRGSGSHLFDFNSAWDSPKNQQVSEQVIREAQKIGPDYIPYDVLKSSLDTVYLYMKEQTLKHRRACMTSYRFRTKLTRRQKAFESLLPQLDTGDLDQYRIVLSRDFTSSDEEDEDGSLKVHTLPWQSETVKKIKERLDKTFEVRFATQKQRDMLQRSIRDDTFASGRTPPANTPSWAIQAKLPN